MGWSVFTCLEAVMPLRVGWELVPLRQIADVMPATAFGAPLVRAAFPTDVALP